MAAPSSVQDLVFENGIVTMCDNRTAGEVFTRGLLGLPKQYLSMVERLVPQKSAVFVYNRDLRVLCGVYVVSGTPGFNLEPTAWSPPGSVISRFPAQCYFQTTLLQGKCPATVWRHLLPSSSGHIRLLDGVTVNSLVKLFAKYRRNAPPTSLSQTLQTRHMQDKPPNKEDTFNKQITSGASADSSKHQHQQCSSSKHNDTAVIALGPSDPLSHVLTQRLVVDGTDGVGSVSSPMKSTVPALSSENDFPSLIHHSTPAVYVVDVSSSESSIASQLRHDCTEGVSTSISACAIAPTEPDVSTLDGLELLMLQSVDSVESAYSNEIYDNNENADEQTVSDLRFIDIFLDETDDITIRLEADPYHATAVSCNSTSTICSPTQALPIWLYCSSGNLLVEVSSLMELRARAFNGSRRVQFSRWQPCDLLPIPPVITKQSFALLPPNSLLFTFLIGNASSSNPGQATHKSFVTVTEGTL